MGDHHRGAARTLLGLSIIAAAIRLEIVVVIAIAIVQGVLIVVGFIADYAGFAEASGFSLFGLYQLLKSRRVKTTCCGRDPDTLLPQAVRGGADYTVTTTLPRGIEMTATSASVRPPDATTHPDG